MTTEQTLEQSVIDAISEWVGETSSDHLVAAARAAVAALRAAGEPVAFVPLSRAERTKGSPVWNETRPAGAPDAWVGYDLMPLYAAQPAPSASVREAAELERKLLDGVVDRQGRQHIMSVFAALSSTPSPLMQTAEKAVETGIIDEMHSALAEVHDALGRAREMIGDVPGNTLDEALTNYIGSYMALQIEVTELRARLAAATSPAKRDYATRVVTDGSFQEGDEIAYEVNEATGIGRVTSHTRTAAEPTREEIALTILKHIYVRDCPMPQVNALEVADAILALKPRGGQTREEIEEDDPEVAIVARAIAENGFTRPWDDFFPVNAFDTDQDDLIEYAKAAVAAMRLIALSKPRGEPAREGGE